MYLSAFRLKIKFGKCCIASEKTCIEVSFFIQYSLVVNAAYALL